MIGDGRQAANSNPLKPIKNRFGVQNVNVIFRDSEVWSKAELTQMFLSNEIVVGTSAQNLKRSLA